MNCIDILKQIISFLNDFYSVTMAIVSKKLINLLKKC